ncbi:MAG: hypothetical protein ACKVPX_03945 [Myxococcaceae bacterium]
MTPVRARDSIDVRGADAVNSPLPAPQPKGVAPVTLGEENDAQSRPWNLLLERRLRQALHNIPLGGSKSFVIEADAQAKLAGHTRNEVTVRRRAQGFELSWSGEASGGLGVGTPWATLVARAGAGGSAAVLFRTAEEAADRLSAVFQTVASAAMPLGKLLQDPDASARFAAAAGSLSEVRLALVGELGASARVAAGQASLGGELGADAKFTLVFDRTRQEVRLEVAVSLSGEASANLGFSTGEFKGALNVDMVGAEVSASRAHVLTLSHEDASVAWDNIPAILSRVAAAARHDVRTTVTVAFPGNASNALVFEQGNANEGWDWSNHSRDIDKVGFDLGMAGVSATVVGERRLSEGKGKTLAESVGEALKNREDLALLERAVEAQRGMTGTHHTPSNVR